MKPLFNEFLMRSTNNRNRETYSLNRKHYKVSRGEILKKSEAYLRILSTNIISKIDHVGLNIFLLILPTFDLAGGMVYIPEDHVEPQFFKTPTKI